MSQTGKWSPNLKDRYEKPGKGEIVEFLANLFQNDIRGQMRDNQGVYAFLLDTEVLVGKDYIYGNIVSCHEDALDTALDQDKWIVMYIRKADKFYAFDPEEIAEGHEGVNKKSGRSMVNFRIDLGQQVEVTEIG